MKKLELEFFGGDSEEIAGKLYTYIVDGGLGDQIVDFLSENKISVSMRDWDNTTLKVLFECEIEN